MNFILRWKMPSRNMCLIIGTPMMAFTVTMLIQYAVMVMVGIRQDYPYSYSRPVVFILDEISEGALQFFFKVVYHNFLIFVLLNIFSYLMLRKCS